MKNQFANLENAREDSQKKVMAEILDANHCPFCLENLKKYHTLPILKETTHWLLTPNQWPYTNTRHHLLGIYKEHVTDLAGLNPTAGAELIELVQWAEQEFTMPGGGLAMRFGDTDYSAGTVNHIHFQLLVPEIEAEDFSEKPVRVKIGKTK